ncbi:uncharacterized protein V1518DRAFT_370612 [Limtongia smithiae]|uniref:uncharacterized protein n=1 Tax=Limtongia smithiae TaxID=1125753 RepID=UPI0034CE4302
MQPKKSIPSLPSYKNLRDATIRSSDEEDEEDWIPLSKATPAPASRFCQSALRMGPLPSTNVGTQKTVIEEEDREPEDGHEDVSETETSKKAYQEIVKPKRQETASGAEEITSPSKLGKGYLSSTAASRMKAPTSPLRPASPMRSPTRNGILKPGLSPSRGGIPVMQPPSGRASVTFSTRTHFPPRNTSPLRNVITRPASPSGDLDKTDMSGPISIQKPSALPRDTQSRALSPTRPPGGLTRQGSQLTGKQAAAIAASTSLQMSAHSPVTSAFKNMKTSTADAFRKARFLLFDGSTAQIAKKKTADGSGSPSRAVVRSPTKSAANSSTTSTTTSTNAARSIYPDITVLLNDKHTTSGPTNKLNLSDSQEVAHTAPAATSNPAKALFPVRAVVEVSSSRLANREEESQPAPSISTSSQRSSTALSLSSASTQRTSFNDEHSGDLNLTPDVAHAGKQESILTTAQSVTTTQSSDPSRDKTGMQRKRVKSAIRKPVTRAKVAPVIVRVPMGAQREIEQQRKIAAAAAAVPSAISQAEHSCSQEEQTNEADKRVQEAARQRTSQQPEEMKRAEEDDSSRPKFGLTNRNSRVPQTRAVASLIVKNEEAIKANKRLYQIETESARLKKSLAPTAYEHPKRRRTGEGNGSPLEQRIRRSVVRKDLGTGVSVTAPPATTSTAPPQQPSRVAPSHAGRVIPVVEGVKFSNERIKFGNATASSNDTSTLTSAKNSGGKGTDQSTATNTNAAAGSNMRLSQIVQAPVTTGDHIVLPEIYSESEDDDDNSVILEWANSPYLQAALRQQAQVDPDMVFGPVPPLSMEEVFRNKGGAPATRFRPRSSSANWNNQDRLTPQEIEAYAIEMGYKHNGDST